MLTEAPESIIAGMLFPAMFIWHFGGLGIPERFAIVTTYSGSESESVGALVRQTRAKCSIFPQNLQSLPLPGQTLKCGYVPSQFPQVSLTRFCSPVPWYYAIVGSQNGILVHHVSVAEEDRDVLHFIWIDDILHNNSKLLVYRFTRVAFGVNSRPFLLNATIDHHIRSDAEDPAFVVLFLSSLYVDDLALEMTSLSCIRKLVNVCQEVVSLSKNGESSLYVDDLALEMTSLSCIRKLVNVCQEVVSLSKNGERMIHKCI